MSEAIIGSLITGAFNKRSADKEMRFQDMQSRTQYQRAVADMKRAGLNPMLSAKLGGNAAMQGASASMPDLGQTINTSKQVSNQKKLVEAQVGLMSAQADQASAAASLSRSQASDIVASQQAGRWAADTESKLAGAAQARSTVRQIEANTEKIVSEIPGVKADSVMKQLSIPEKEALNRLYEAMDGDVGLALKSLQELKKAGAGVDTVLQALGLGGLLRKLGLKKTDQKAGKVPAKDRVGNRKYVPRSRSSQEFDDNFSLNLLKRGF